jgi:mono/diheme cytochrome c family protein
MHSLEARRIAVIAVAYAACAVLAACVRQQIPISRTASFAQDNSLANGHSIFQTGRDLAGKQITATGTPMFNRCSACHEADGSGGKHFDGGEVSADLRHPALVTDQRHPYDLGLLERAISTGVDNDGEKLDPVMPRWRLSRRDLHDVAEYVLTELK